MQEQQPVLCRRCGKDGIVITKRTPYTLHTLCLNCDAKGELENGPRERGFLNPNVESRKVYGSQLAVLAALEALGEATQEQIAEYAGLRLSQVSGTIGRMFKRKGRRVGDQVFQSDKFIDYGTPVMRFPSGLVRRYRITDAGRWQLEQAREQGYLPRAEYIAD